jgi:hypothetical protein
MWKACRGEWSGAGWGKRAGLVALLLAVACGDSGPLIVSEEDGEAGAGGSGGGAEPDPSGGGASGGSGGSGGGAAGDPSGGGASGGNGESNAGASAGGGGGGTSLPDEPLESDWVFDETALRTYELTIAPDDLETLERTATDEEYVPAALRVDDTELDLIGVRYKGSLGTLVSCFDESGERTCDKLSFKLKFSEYLPDQRLRGLRRLTFNSRANDESQLRERLAYRVFREMGVVAPRSAHARLVINGEDQGLFRRLARPCACCGCYACYAPTGGPTEHRCSVACGLEGRLWR